MSDINGRIISGFYRSSPREVPTLYMSIRTVDGKKKFITGIDSPVKPYFYIDKKDKETAEKALTMSGLSKLDFKFIDPKMRFGMHDGKPLKCEMWEPWRVGETREYLKKSFNIEADEADIMYMRRVLIDKNIKAAVSIKNGEIFPYGGEIPAPRLLFLDTEIDDSRGFPEEHGEYTILCVGTTDDEGKTKYFSWKFGDSTEAQMLEEFFNYALQYDYLVAWNKDFDEKHIVKRSRKLGLGVEWRFFRWVDLAEFHKKYYQKTYYEKLHVAYRDILKKFRAKLTKKGIKIRDEQITRLKGYYKTWFVKPDILEDVNTSHAYALYVMEEAMDVINLYSQVADEVGIFIDYTVYNSHIVDTYALRLIKEYNLGWVIPSLRRYKKRIGYRGAIVSAPVRGIHSFVYLYDFRSLYNNVIQSYLLDPICYQKWNGTFTETGIDEYIKYAKSFGEIYGIDGLPLFPAILQRLEKARNEYKNLRSNYEHGSAEYEEYEQKQKAAKAVLLSTYGVLGMSSSRWAINKTIPLEMMLVIEDENAEEADYRVPNVPEEKFVGMVTHIAREALIGATEYLKKDKNINVLYGDSVREDTPIIIKELGLVKYIPIEDLSVSPNTNTRIRHETHEKVMDETGWTESKYIYKHKIKKKMYGILTRKSYIECSEDHSLVVNGVKTKPTDLQVGDTVDLVKHPQLKNLDVDAELAWLIGFYLADGSSGIYKYKTGIKYSWYISQSKQNGALEKSQRILRKLGLNTKIINTHCSKNMRRLIPSGCSKTITLLFQFWCHSKRNKKVIPAFILNSNAKRDFLDGIWTGDGSVDKRTKIKAISLTDKCLLAGICNILNSLKIDYSLSVRGDKQNVIRLRIIRDKNDIRIRKENEIIKIRELEIKHESIYDIETESHHFAGGIGNVLLHNTDSSYIAPFNLIGEEKTYRNLTQEDITILESFGNSCGEKLEKYFSESFEEGIEMKLEKIFDRALFGSAKKNYYCRTIYDEDTGWQLDENGKLTWYEYVKGLPLVRTDRTEFLQMFQRKIFQEMLDNPERLYKICEEIIKEFYENKYDHMLIIKSAMKKPLNQYKTKTLATQAAQKLIERGEPVRPGEKIHLIVTDIVRKTEVIDGKKKTKYVKVIEPIDDSISPKEAIAKLPPLRKKALDYYWDNRIWKNIEPFLHMVLDESEIKRIRFLKERKTSLDQFMVSGSGGQ